MMQAILQALQKTATELLIPLIDRREDYQYDPLPSARSLRLLSFNTDDSSQINITLETFELANAPPYQALSYCWESPFDVPNFELPDLFIQASGPIAIAYSTNKKKPIVCNHSRMYISKNLKEFFDRLREEGYAQMEHKHLWVDAVCIDQGNPKERTAQVLRMGHIYKNAISVFVWLGDSLPETSLAIAVFEELRKIPMCRLEEMKGLSITSDATYDALGIRGISEREWRAFVGFSRRTYFNRVWVVQEAIFARRLIFLCGEFHIPTETLFEVSKRLVLSGWSSQILGPYVPQFRPGSGPQVGAIAAIFQMMNDLERGTVRPLEILSSMRSRRAKRPLDKVYSLLNLIAKALDTEPSELPVLPDYESELADVLEQTTLICIRSSKNLDFLSAVQERTMRSSAVTPSWVVDWSVPLAPVPLMTMQLINGLWNPSNGLPPGLPETGEPGILKFLAARVCGIERVSLDTGKLQKDQDLASWVDLILEMDVPYGADTGQGLTETLWRTVIADIAWDQHPAPADFGLAFVYNYIGMVVCRTASIWSASRFEIELEDMIHQIDRLRSIDPSSVFPGGDEIRRLARVMKGEDPEHNQELLVEIMSKVEALSEHINRVCIHRRLGRTDLNLLAMVPASTEPGDSIWILPGLSTPFVFREMFYGNFQLIGEAYVHGIMSGEAMGNLELTPVRLQ
ncbi:heterokaryon incompatibility protein-domain-containing protein [Tricladium varicosporioides]|nr:heterokaryon incompatibility protein-domain-containing protein [Hymenoscyphus varicosporioides]